MGLCAVEAPRLSIGKRILHRNAGSQFSLLKGRLCTALDPAVNTEYIT